MDTNTTNPAAAVTAKPMRLKHAFAYAVCGATEAGVKTLNSAATIVTGVATRITLHNAGCYLDMVEDQNGNETLVVNAINKVIDINKAL